LIFWGDIKKQQKVDLFYIRPSKKVRNYFSFSYVYIIEKAEMKKIFEAGHKKQTILLLPLLFSGSLKIDPLIS